jgi:hypothetical protein
MQTELINKSVAKCLDSLSFDIQDYEQPKNITNRPEAITQGSKDTC